MQPAPQAHDEPGSRQHQVLLVVDGARQQKLAQLPRALPPRLQDSGRLPGTSGSRPAAVPDVQLGIRQRGLESPPAKRVRHPQRRRRVVTFAVAGSCRHDVARLPSARCQGFEARPEAGMIV